MCSDVAPISPYIWSDAYICVLSHVFCVLHPFTPRHDHNSNIGEWVGSPFFLGGGQLSFVSGTTLLVSVWVVSWLGCVSALTGWQEVAAHRSQIKYLPIFCTASCTVHLTIECYKLKWQAVSIPLCLISVKLAAWNFTFCFSLCTVRDCSYSTC